MKKFLIILLALSIFGYVAYTYYKANIAIAATTAEKEAAYMVTKATLKNTLNLSGKIDASEKATLGFQTAGRLAWVGVKEGDYVKKGQGIASLDQRELQKNLEKQLNTYLIARWDFDQVKVDNKDAAYKDGDVGDKLKRLIDKSQFGLNNSVLNVELQSISKEYSYLASPISGIVTKVTTPYAGVNIGIASTYEVVNPNTIYFSASADQTEVPKLYVGQDATILMDAYAGEPIRATVTSLSFTPKVGEAGTIYEAKLRFESDNIALKYRLGMTGDAEFVTKEYASRLAIPPQYIKTELKKKYVTKIVNGKKVKTEVAIGEEADVLVEIKSGLKDGDMIIETK
jgi:RND family efflux transporter MFP subunit